MPALRLDPDRFFDPDPAVRRIARELHAGVRDLSIVSPHGHVDAAIFADDAPFPEPTALIVTPDHYLLRLLHSHGVPLERLGLNARDGTPHEVDPRAAWRLFAANYHRFRATPSAIWLDYVLAGVFGASRRLDEASADVVYDEIREKLASPEFRPRALYERFNIEVLATTDGAADTLEHHRRLRESGWQGRVIPTFRPDAVFKVAAPAWRGELERLERAHGGAIPDLAALVGALAGRRAFFRSLGATAADHGTLRPHTELLPDDEAEDLFARALAGEATFGDERRFEAHLLMEMARLSVADGLVMQLHSGSWRDHDASLLARFGPNRGGDIPLAAEYTRSLHALLNTWGNDPGFRLIVFTLDESTYARELAPLAGHYSALFLGPPWWFHDSVDGMIRFRARTTETAGLGKTAGFNDDTRAFCSIPARHDLSRRVDANWLAGLVARHVVEMDDAREMGRALAGDLAREAYRLDRRPPPAGDDRA